MTYSLDAIYKNSRWAIGQNASILAALQQKAATGQEVNRVSDNPTDSNQILSLLTDSRTKEQTLKTMDEMISTLDLSASVIQSITSEFGRARTSLTSTMSGTLNVELRQTLAAGLDNILEEMVSLVNTQRMGQSLFAGADSEALPYTVERDEQGHITRVNYQGSLEERNVKITEGLEVSGVLTGPALFSSQQRGEPVFYGQTGAAAGTGTSSIRGDVQLTVTGSAGNWQLSIDGGVNVVNVNGTESNVAVVHSETGKVLYVDATGIQQAGAEPVRIPGTYDLFNVLISTRDLLKNDQNYSEAQLRSMLSDTVQSMDEVNQRLVQAFPVVGGRLQVLTNFKESIEDMKLATDENISRIQDTDITQVAIDLARYEMLYQMSLSVASRMFSMSLLDFMQ
ncbi:MAG: flagellar hook-associated protein FlgL [Phycisphaerae bacterium]|nr:flagellar hook-associated protein FlgL [Phycisphaerae bacterium]